MYTEEMARLREKDKKIALEKRSECKSLGIMISFVCLLIETDQLEGCVDESRSHIHIGTA